MNTPQTDQNQPQARQQANCKAEHHSPRPESGSKVATDGSGREYRHQHAEKPTGTAGHQSEFGTRGLGRPCP